MNKTVKVSLLLFGLCVFGGGLIALARSPLMRGSGQPQQDGGYQNPEAQIDQKAQAIVGADETHIRNLADAVFHVPSLVSIPETIARPFKERLVRSEISYRQGQSKGIAEENLVRVMDELAQKFDAPEYARTSQEEVRDLRLMISYSMPHFIPRQTSPDKTDTEQRLGFSVGPLMSPLEAIYVAQALIVQKEINEYFQLTQSERAELKSTLRRLDDQFRFTPEERAGVAMALIQQKLNGRAPRRTPEELAALAKQRTAEQGGGTPQATLSVRPSSPRQAEMQEVLRRANSMKVKEALDLTDRLLGVLGV
jgi:hypothetical protein